MSVKQKSNQQPQTQLNLVLYHFAIALQNSIRKVNKEKRIRDHFPIISKFKRINSF